ncbi:MAG: hypothetical protein ACXWW8_06855, partial [Solirubrobacterales bacterium]
GMDGRMIDFARGEEIPTRAAVEALMEWASPAAAQLGIELRAPGPNGSQRAREALAGGDSIEDVYRRSVEETRRTYATPEPARPGA